MRRLLSLVLVIAATSSIRGDGEPHPKVSSAGSYPVSKTVFATWLNGPTSDKYPHPFLMVYFRGPGWLKGKIESGFGFQRPSGSVSFSSALWGTRLKSRKCIHLLTSFSTFRPVTLPGPIY